jgi:hypothetical protein
LITQETARNLARAAQSINHDVAYMIYEGGRHINEDVASWLAQAGRNINEQVAQRFTDIAREWRGWNVLARRLVGRRVSSSAAGEPW